MSFLYYRRFNTRRDDSSIALVTPPSCLSLYFALVVAHELSRSACDGKLPCLLDLGLERDPVAVPPHLSDESLAWDDRARKAYLYVLEGAEPDSVLDTVVKGHFMGLIG